MKSFLKTVFGLAVGSLLLVSSPVSAQSRAEIDRLQQETNSRMGFELKSRLVKPAVHSEVMAWSNITGVRMEGELIDFESSLRVGRFDGWMEASGRERI